MHIKPYPGGIPLVPYSHRISGVINAPAYYEDDVLLDAVTLTFQGSDFFQDYQALYGRLMHNQQSDGEG
jgi:hypothetical protein